MSERQWGTVCEDYSQSGDAWDYFTHDEARSRAYRRGEDGLAGISDTVNLTVSNVGGVTLDDHLRSVLRTAIPTILISAALYLLLGLTGGAPTGSILPRYRG